MIANYNKLSIDPFPKFYAALACFKRFYAVFLRFRNSSTSPRQSAFDDGGFEIRIAKIQPFGIYAGGGGLRRTTSEPSAIQPVYRQ
jgi:hypothetical protein